MKFINIVFIMMSSIIIFGSCSSKQDKAYLDLDRDGYGTVEITLDELKSKPFAYQSGDCDDANPDIHPNSIVEENSDGNIDFNCDGIFYFLPKEKVVQNSYESVTDVFEYNGEENILIKKSYQGDKRKNKLSERIEKFFDAQGNLIRVKFYHFVKDKAEIYKSHELLYSNRGSLFQHIEYQYLKNKKKKTALIEYSYDDEGLLSHWQTFDLTGAKKVAFNSKKIFYNNKKQKIREELFEEGGLESPMTRSFDYFYDTKGHLETIKSYEERNTPVQLTDIENFSYSSKGKLLRYQKLSPQRGEDHESSVKVTEEFTYDLKGEKLLLFERKGYPNENYGDGSLKSSITMTQDYVYDEQERLVNSHIHDQGTKQSPLSKEIIYKDYFSIMKPIGLNNES